MIILSFDVGIKNLAYCLISINLEKQLELEKQEKQEKQSDDVDFLQILKWDVVDLSTTSSEIVTTSVTHVSTTSVNNAINHAVTQFLKQGFKCQKNASCCTHSSTMLPEDVKKYCKNTQKKRNCRCIHDSLNPIRKMDKIRM